MSCGSPITSSNLYSPPDGYKYVPLDNEINKVESWLGISISLIVIGFTSRAFNISDMTPVWISGMDAVNSYVPFLKNLKDTIFSYFNQVVIMLFVINLMDRTKYFTKKKRGLIVILSSTVFASDNAFEGLS